MNKTIFSIIMSIAVLVGIFLIARPNNQNTISSPNASNEGMLTVEETGNYDFGSVSMAVGKVNHIFRVKNSGSNPVIINKVYTSCMCTTATLMMGGKQFGPFGMPGHGSVPKVIQTLNPNEEVNIDVVFDPAAHGPAGIGVIERAVYLENNAGEPLIMTIKATVTP